MTPAELSDAVLCTLRRAVAVGELHGPVPERVVVERPRGPRRGDYATAVALRLARPAGRPPRQVAEILAARLSRWPGVARVEVTDPGFLNITVAAGAQADVVRAVRAAGPRYGHGDALAGTSVALVHDGGTRAAAVAEAAERLLRACGARTGGGAAETLRVAEVAERPAELVALLGADAARWALLRPPPGDAPCLEAAVHLPQRETNPLFRVRYAHARTRALLRNARDLGFEPQEGNCGSAAEAALLGVVADYPRIVEAAARHRGPDRLARHLERVADAFFRMHDTCPVLPRGDEKPSAAHRSRLALADAAGTVLAGGLTLLGISAPERL